MFSIWMRSHTIVNPFWRCIIYIWKSYVKGIESDLHIILTLVTVDRSSGVVHPVLVVESENHTHAGWGDSGDEKGEPKKLKPRGNQH